jgi:hypothetical protein
MSEFKIPKTDENLRATLLKLIGNAQQDSVLIMFCKELEASGNQKEIDYFCNNCCEFHKLPLELYCLPHSTKAKLSVNVKGENGT